MKPFKKKSIFISFILLAIGALCLIIGLISGGKADFRINYSAQKVYVEDQNYISDTISLDKFSHADIQVDNCDIIVKCGPEPKLEYKIPEEYSFSQQFVNRELKITAKQKTTFSFDLSFFSKSSSYILLTVPEKDFKKLNATSDNGDIELKKVNALSIFAETGSGDISISEIDVSNLTATTDNGDIFVNNSKANRTTTLETDNGNISSNSSEFHHIKIENDNGDILLKQCDITNGTIECDNGDIDARLIRAGELALELYTDYGDITVNQKKYDSNAHIPASNDVLSPNLLKIKTDNGDIFVITR